VQILNFSGLGHVPSRVLASNNTTTIPQHVLESRVGLGLGLVDVVASPGTKSTSLKVTTAPLLGSMHSERASILLVAAAELRTPTTWIVLSPPSEACTSTMCVPSSLSKPLNPKESALLEQVDLAATYLQVQTKLG
jgi:hypothetical protein